MAVKEVALVQHRRGLSTALPDSLEEAEIGLITDTGDVVIGAPGNPLVSGRGQAETNIYPYENIQFLTELSENLDIIQHAYESNTGVTAVFPTVITGSAAPTALASGDTINLNTIIIDLTTGPSPGTSLDNAVSAINASALIGIYAVNYNGVLRIISTTGNDVSIINVAGTPLQKLQLIPGSETGVTFPANSFITRTLQSVTDDTLSIKSYGAIGDGNQDADTLINAAFISLYARTTDVETRRTVFFPAGVYILEDDSVFLPPYLTMKGEGIDKTILQRTTDTSGPVLQTMDGNGFFSNLLAFGTNGAAQPQFITIEDMTFENLNDVTVATLTAASDITFRRCKFKTAGTAETIVTAPLGGPYTTSANVRFEECIFDSGDKGLDFVDLKSNITVVDCTFTNISNEPISFNGTNGDAISNVLVRGNYFNQVAATSNVCCYAGVFEDDIQFVDNRFNLAIGVLPVKLDNPTSYSNHRSATVDIANTASLQFESFALGTATDAIISIDYVVDSINNPRAGTVTIFYDASTSATSSLTLNDSNPDATAVFTAVMSNPAGEADLTIQNASTGADLKLRYSYRYST